VEGNEENMKSIDSAINDLDNQIDNHRKSANKVFLNAVFFPLIVYLSLLVVTALPEITDAVCVGEVSNEKNSQAEVPIHEVQDKKSASSLTKLDFEARVARKEQSASLLAKADSGTPVTQDEQSASSLTKSGFEDNLFKYSLLTFSLIVFGVSISLYRFHLSEMAKSEHHRLAFLRIRVAANNYTSEGFQTEVREALTCRAFEYAVVKDKKVESPLPGHPGSDITAIVLNKILDNVDVRLKKERNNEGNGT